MGIIDEARGKTRAARQAIAEADAARMVANGRLDQYCVAFGDDLYLDVGKDRQSTRWRKFFTGGASRFIRQAMGRQVDTVKGWLTTSDDPVLEKHRENLAKWSGAADEAIVKTRASSLVRGESRQGREEMAEALTRERDGLAEALAARARERGLPRTWPAVFFRVTRHQSANQETSPASPPETSPATPPTATPAP